MVPFENAHASKLVCVSDTHDEQMSCVMKNEYVETEMYLSTMTLAETANVRLNCSRLQVSTKYVY